MDVDLRPRSPRSPRTYWSIVCAAIAAWPIAVVSSAAGSRRRRRSASGLLDLIDGIDGDRAAPAVETLSPSAKSAIWPMAEMIMSHRSRLRCRRPACGVMPFIVHRQTRSAVARPFSSLITSSGMTPPTISTPSRLASSRSARRRSSARPGTRGEHGLDAFPPQIPDDVVRGMAEHLGVRLLLRVAL